MQDSSEVWSSTPEVVCVDFAGTRAPQNEREPFGLVRCGVAAEEKSRSPARVPPLWYLFAELEKFPSDAEAAKAIDKHSTVIAPCLLVPV